jgi:hypothetical protein
MQLCYPMALSFPLPPIRNFFFVQPDNRPGETDPIPEPQFVTAVSGKKLLRDIMLENQVELYGPYVRQSFPIACNICLRCLVVND